MEDRDRQEWSRHFDNLMWGMIAFSVASIGAFLIHATDHPSVLFGISGIFALNVAVYLVASFRGLRRKVAAGQSFENLIRPDKLRQRTVMFVAVFAALAGWVRVLYFADKTKITLWIVVAIVSFVLSIVFVMRGDHQPTKQS